LIGIVLNKRELRLVLMLEKRAGKGNEGGKRRRRCLLLGRTGNEYKRERRKTSRRMEQVVDSLVLLLA